MPTLADVKVDSIFALFKGELGTRKSTSALSFPRPQEWLSTDRKMNSLLLPASKWGINFKEINFNEYDDWTKMQARLEYLQMHNSAKTVIIDNITMTGDNINLQTIDLKKGTTNKEGAEKGFRIGGIAVNTIDDYKAEASAFTQMIAILKDIKSHFNANIVLIGHVIGERTKSETSGITSTSRVIITGGKTISGKIAAMCDEIYHFDVAGQIDATKAPEFCVYTVHTGVDFARTALPLPSKIIFNDEPLYDKWIKPAQEQLRKDLEKRPVQAL